MPEEIEICNKNMYNIVKNCPNIALSKNRFANYIMKSEEPFNEINFDNFKLIFDIIMKIQNCPTTNFLSYKEDCVSDVEVDTGVHVKTFHNGLQVLEVYLRETDLTSKMKGIGSLGVLVKIDNDCFNIVICFDNEQFQISLPINEILLDFLMDKIDNESNKIELHFFGENGVRIVEVLKGTIASTLIRREISKLFS